MLICRKSGFLLFLSQQILKASHLFLVIITIIKKEESTQSVENQLPAIKPQIIETSSQLIKLVESLQRFNQPLSPVAIDTETTNLNPFKAELVGLGFCFGKTLKEAKEKNLGELKKVSFKGMVYRSDIGFDLK